MVASNEKMNSSNPEWNFVMEHMNLRTTLKAAALTGAMIVGTNALADPPRTGYDMGPGMIGGYGLGWMGGYGGLLVPVFLVIVVIGFVVLIAKCRWK